MQDYLRYKFFLMLLFFWNVQLHAQHQQGMRLENRAGLNSLAINPALILNNTTKWEIHLFGAGLFMENNYFFLRNTSARRLFKHRNDLSLVFDKRSDTPNIFEIDFAKGDQKRFLNTNLYVTGPGISFRINEHNSIALFSQMRSILASNKIPGEYSYYHITNRPFNQPFAIKPYKAALLNWFEFGINYAKKIEFDDRKLDVGISIKYLSGYDAVSLESKSSYDHSVINTNDFAISGGNFSFSYSPVESLLSQVNGRGISLDIGFNYALMQDLYGNTWKVGASIVDLGMLRFTRTNTLDFKSDTTLTVIGNNFINTDLNNGLNDVTERFVQTVIGNNSDLVRRSNSRMFTPTTVMIHTDYQMSKNVYLNGLWIQSLQFFGAGPVNGSLIGLTPRWESVWYSVSMPVSLYQLQKLHVGFAGRIGYFNIGSDNISGIFKSKNFTGTDIYTSIKIPFGAINSNIPFKRMGKKVKGSIECYPM